MPGSDQSENFHKLPQCGSHSLSSGMSRKGKIGGCSWTLSYHAENEASIEGTVDVRTKQRPDIAEVLLPVFLSPGCGPALPVS